ncbi:MAG: toprim domain-containing protein [Myxococcaceae bacterium]|nr:toprim domain-containing protein [Myxococcaceae bacterium]
MASRTAPSACGCPTRIATPARPSALGCRPSCFARHGTRASERLPRGAAARRGRRRGRHVRAQGDGRSAEEHPAAPLPARPAPRGLQLCRAQRPEERHRLRGAARRDELLGSGVSQRHPAYGVEGFTAHHLDALKRHGVKDVLIAYDRDDAGDAGAEALAKKLMPEGLSCWRVLFPRGMDANDYAVKVAPASKSLSVALRQAAWMGQGAAPGVPSFRGAVDASTSVTPAAASSLVAQPPATTSAAEIHPAPSSSSSPVSAAPKAPELQLEEKDDELVLHFGPRRYRVRGLPKALSAEVMKLNLLVSAGELFHVDTLDMYSARARAAFVRQAVDELRVPEEALKRDMGALLLKLEELQEKQLKEKLQPKAAAPTLSDEETAAALELLKSPNLLERVVADFARCGVVGEESNKLLGYLAAVSRKLEEPLAVLIQSSSAAGKSSLMEAVLAFVPDEDKVKYSAMTGQSLFYMGDLELKHKVLAVVEEEGAARASYAL